MISVVIPAHNEELVISGCVQSICAASAHPQLGGEKVLITVVADDCSDLTEAFASIAGATVISVFKRNVGIARALGADLAIAYGARWLAFTDADTIVSSDWLVNQMQCSTDAVCGVISIEDWTHHSPSVRDDFNRRYRDIDGHRHIHGANLGCSATAYQRAGGFPPLAFNEDVALVDALIATDSSIAWTNRVRVTTSARRDFCAPWGLGATLQEAERETNAHSTPISDPPVAAVSSIYQQP